MAKSKKSGKSGGGFRGGVHVSASLERANHAAVAGRKGYSYGLRKLFLDEAGDVAADAGCAKVHICERKDIPKLIDFLSKIAKAK